MRNRRDPYISFVLFVWLWVYRVCVRVCFVLAFSW